MKYTKVLIVLLLVVAGVLGGERLLAKTLEYEDVHPFEAKEESLNGQVVLRVKGLCGHSAYVVDSIKENLDGKDVNLLVEIALSVLKKGTGNFDFEVKIPNDVERVSFGEKKHVIWTRHKLSAQAHMR